MVLSMLEALPSYFMSLYRMPMGVAKIGEKLMRQFLWKKMGSDSMYALVAWEGVVKPKKEGGLGKANTPIIGMRIVDLSRRVMHLGRP
ncbi:hypothetical protein Scep_026822 [Stephania cephalantha]|uniref:Uncharacterized protein n=1 Tax=Stephania cephalantha TaxID=152367 RepID=A0AAP0HNI6_9MAGN